MTNRKKSIKKARTRQTKQKKEEKPLENQVIEKEEEKQALQEQATQEEKRVEEQSHERRAPQEKKAVDEDWKEQIHREKEVKKEEKPPPIPPPNFILFVSGFATQTLIALGQIENPITKTKEKNLDQAKYTIDTLTMIKEKTKGNLTTEEEKFLDSVLYDLQMSYVSSVK